MNYGVPYNLCDESNNNISLKDQYIREIFAYTQPDLLAVVEMIEGIDNVKRLLDSAVNAAGPRIFAKAGITNFSNSEIINMLYYDPVKFTLKSQDAIITGLRDINIYNLFLNSTDLSLTQDTVFLTVIIAHLKAGSGQSNETERAQMVLSLMNYLNAQNKQGNIILSGDFNLYTSNEQAFQTLLNYSNQDIRFYDPIDSPGDWNSNINFAGIHTQSTHLGSNGCASGGGMDDRFDFILTSSSLMQGSDRMKNITSSYRALGQDGLHFNNSVNDMPENTSVPPVVLEALYSNSDHLPVIMDIRTEKVLAINETLTDPFEIKVTNPAKGNIQMSLGRPPASLTIECVDFVSHQVMSTLVEPQPASEITIPASGLKTGMYLLRFTSKTGLSTVKKVIIQ